MTSEIVDKLKSIKKNKEKSESISKTIETLDAFYHIAVNKADMDKLSIEKLEQLQQSQNILQQSIKTFEEAQKKLSNSIKFDELIAKIDEQITIIKSQSHVDIVDAVNAISGALSNFKQSHEMTVNSIKSVSDTTILVLDKVTELVAITMESKEEPKETEFKRDSSGQIVEVIEHYATFNLNHRWVYDTLGNLRKIITTKK